MLVVSFLEKMFLSAIQGCTNVLFLLCFFSPCFLDEMVWDQQSYSGEMKEMGGLKQAEWVGGSDLVSY